MAENFANEPRTTLTAGINASVTSLVVSSATGFPAANFRIRIDNEIMLVTVVAGTTWTVTRGVESTVAASHGVLATVFHILTAAGLTQAIVDTVAATADGSALLTQDPFINRETSVWHGATSLAAIADATETAVCWFFRKPASAAVLTVSRSTDVPLASATVAQPRSSLKAAVTTVDSSIAAADAVWLEFRVEGANWREIAGRAFSLPVAVRSAKTGVHCIALGNGTDRTCVFEITVPVADTWAIYSLTVPASPSAGTWDYDFGTGLRVYFVLAAGSNYQTASVGAWNSDTKVATANQVNCLDTIGNSYQCLIAGPPLPGAATVPAPTRTYGETLQACGRYRQKSCSDGTAALSATFEGAVQIQVSDNANNKVISTKIIFPIEMRAVPTISLVDLNGNLSKITTYDAAGTGTNNVTPNVGVINAGSKGFGYSQTATIAGYAFGWAADAHLT